MKKTYSKAELEQKAKETVFKDYPKADKAFATVDGIFFLNENRANLHAGAKGKVIEIANDGILEGDDSKDTIKPKTADVLITEAKTIETIDLVEVAKDIEAKGKNRTTVITAYDARIAELKPAE